MTWLRRLRIRTAESCSDSARAGRKRYQMCSGRVVPKPGHGKPVEGEREDQDEQDAEPEAGRGEGEQEDHPDHLVEPAALVDRGQQAEGEREDRREHHRVDGEADRDRHPAEHHVAHWLVVDERRAHIALHQPGHEEPVLFGQWLVQAELVVQLGDVLRGPPVAQQHGCRVAGQEVHHAEDDDGHAEEDENRQDQASADVRDPAHGRQQACARLATCSA